MMRPMPRNIPRVLRIVLPLAYLLYFFNSGPLGLLARFYGTMVLATGGHHRAHCRRQESGSAGDSGAHRLLVGGVGVFWVLSGVVGGGGGGLVLSRSSFGLSDWLSDWVPMLTSEAEWSILGRSEFRDGPESGWDS